METLEGFSRSCYCGEPRLADVGIEYSVTGWVARQRDLGGLIFIDLRDRSGVLQLAFDEGTERVVFEKAFGVRSEYVVAARGVLRERSSKNPELPTGDVELEVTELRILSVAETTPFFISDTEEVNDALRLRYRYLDLRRPEMQRILALRHRIVKFTRDFFDLHGFYEIETPILTRSSPEGARDYLVPSRVHPGKFYALPQSPQQYKQLLMVAGFDRYFQIARCFRDEDLRADRQPEFTQLDVEMSFAGIEEILTLNELYLKLLFKTVLDVEVTTPIRRMSWHEARERYGSDKPDLRFGSEICDISQIVSGSAVKMFTDAVEAGGTVRGVTVPGASMSRKQIDSLTEYVKTYGARGLAWLKIASDGVMSSSFAKNLTDAETSELLACTGAGVGDLLLVVADSDTDTVLTSLGALRCECAVRLGLIPSDRYEFVWITEFPLYEYSKTAGRYMAAHHPFTSPLDSDVELMESEPGKCRAKAYDIVLNGTELGGGSIRINTPELQMRMFRSLGIIEELAREQFGHLLEAFRYGAPPHGGIAYGVDRLVMLMAGTDNIRDVIAFPKVQNASEPLTQSPSEVSSDQLTELRIRVDS